MRGAGEACVRRAGRAERLAFLCSSLKDICLQRRRKWGEERGLAGVSTTGPKAQLGASSRSPPACCKAEAPHDPLDSLTSAGPE